MLCLSMRMLIRQAVFLSVFGWSTTLTTMRKEFQCFQLNFCPWGEAYSNFNSSYGMKLSPHSGVVFAKVGTTDWKRRPPMPIRISIHILLSVCYFFILQKLILQKYANKLSIKALIRSYKAILDVKGCFGKLFFSVFES